MKNGTHARLLRGTLTWNRFHRYITATGELFFLFYHQIFSGDNRFKQMTADKSIHFVNFWPRNLKCQIKILKNYNWTQQNGLPEIDFTKEGPTLKEEDLMILRTFIP